MPNEAMPVKQAINGNRLHEYNNRNQQGGQQGDLAWIAILVP